ncbi:sugar-binding protein [Sediminibacillus massiliensis]|uniref:sugar-binding protein n=1 Tax=Sediminibacillus massiliensis TaxID=1926277 RepID=UPI0009885498|nr:sugar-binding protein [Sediminibacillus massiliensis]
MNNLPKKTMYTLGAVIFLVSLFLMLYYGKETFYMENQTASSQQIYDYHFALITEEVGNEYWRLIENGAKEEAGKHNVYLEYVGPRKSDKEEKLHTIDRMISSKVDGIITQGIPGEAFKELVHKAVERGIDVITVDTDVPDSDRQVYVGTDNYQAGFLAGKALLNDTSGVVNVGIVTGSLDALNQQERIAGFKDALQMADRVRLVDIEESNITEIGAAQAAYSLLKDHPDINALFGTSALDGVGIVQGIEEIHLPEHPYIVGFDILPQTVELIEQGKIDATITQFPMEMGRLSVRYMIDLQQEKVIPTLQNTETSIIRNQDIKNGEVITKGDQS